MIVIIVIAGLSISTVLLSISYNEKRQEIEQLNADRNVNQTFYGLSNPTINAEQALDILENNGITAREIVNAIYEQNKEAFADVTNSFSEETALEDPADVIEPPSFTPENQENETVPLPASPYAHLFPHLYSDFISPESYRDDTGYVYLTFDDGPSNVTHNILMYLDKHDVKATFFVMPDDTENGRNFLNHMLDNGHVIGIHSMTHVYNEIYASVEAFLDDFNQAYNLVYEQTGFKPYLFRFPGGSINNYNEAVSADIIAEMTRRGFVYFDWNVDSRDALNANWSQMWNSVLADVEEIPTRSIVLFHDRPGGMNTVLVIEDIIKELLIRGYTLSPILPDTRPMQF
jgi:peptidoglycan/xylan/chitin deacetylase (PgdA/CDA1 family)